MRQNDRNTNDQGKSNYYWANGQRHELFQEPSVYALKLYPGRSDLSPEALDILRQRSDPLLFIEHKGIKVYQTDSDTRQRALRVLNGENAVEFATPAFRRAPESEELMFVTNQFMVQFKPDITRSQIDAINSKHNVRIVGELDYAPNGFLLEGVPNQQGTSAIELANLYYEGEPTQWAHPVTVRRQATKQVINVRVPGVTKIAERSSKISAEGEIIRRAGDFLSEQWHLETDHCKVIDAWNLSIANSTGSPNIRIAILDDGTDVDHPEFQGKVAAQFDFNTNTSDARPKRSQDKHGTACAGVAVAAGVKAFGAAPGCQLIAARMPMFVGPDDEARMFKWACDQRADVISCSWGPPDGPPTIFEPLPDSVRTAIRYCVTNGRDGKGIPVFFAAGNGNELVSMDGYASNPDVIAVAACTSQHAKSHYSDFGPEIWITASSNGSRSEGDRAIFTVDRHGADGYNSGSAALGDAGGNYVNTFGGTSSATPLAAGIAALILSANPDLKANPNQHEVREILAQTAERIGSGYDSRGHSDIFGYGRVNAKAAVEEALRRKHNGGTVPDEETTGRPIIQPVLASVPRDGNPPEFRVDPRPRQFYVVEVATRPELFNFSSSSSQRTPSNFFGSWATTPFSSSSSYPATYRLPQSAWDQLDLSGGQLFYRIWATDSSTGWVNEQTSIDDSQSSSAPSFQITGSNTSGGTSSTGGTVRYASGAVFNIVSSPQDGVDYSDPAAGEIVSLIDVAGRAEERLSANFKVKELAARDGARYARISPELVAGLQRLRERLGSAININSGYRHPALNDSVGGADESRHMSGQAADIQSNAVTPLELARLALEVLGCNIGIGLGKNSIHVDLRGRLTSWTYEGAEMNEAEFDEWVRQECATRQVRSRMSEETSQVPYILGPDVHDPLSQDGPAFNLYPGLDHSYQVEVTTRLEFFAAPDDRAGLPIGSSGTNFFRSEREDPLQRGVSSTVYTLPDGAWQRLRQASRLYYRMLVFDKEGVFATTPDEQAGAAPWIDLRSRTETRLRLGISRPIWTEPDLVRRRDDARWNSEERQ